MSTALELITGSLENIGMIGAGETLSAEDSKMALRSLNLMLSSWNTQKLLMLGEEFEEFNTIPGQDSYTLGAGGDFDTSVPVFTKSAYVKDSSDNTYPVEIVDSSFWGKLNTGNFVSSTPSYIYIDYNHPLKKVHVYPSPPRS